MTVANAAASEAVKSLDAKQLLHLSDAAELKPTLSAAAMSSHQGAHGAHGDHGTPSAQANTGDLNDGEVRKVDLEGGKLTLKHAYIKRLDMPAMTMAFVVKDKAMQELAEAIKNVTAYRCRSRRA